MNDPDLTKFKAALAAKRQREAAAQASVVEHDADLVPDLPFERSDADLEMDRVIESIDILDAYRRWCGKMTPKVRGGQREGIQISCPIPGHEDTHPSAWINLDKQLWHCGACDQGGDKHVIAAYHFGYTVPEYKEGKNFVELREKMAEDYGFRTLVHPGGVVAYLEERSDQVDNDSEESDPLDHIPETPGQEERDGAPSSGNKAVQDEGSVRSLDERVGGSLPSTSSAAVTPISSAPSAPVEESVEEYDRFPSLNWKPIVPTDTFLDSYMSLTTTDDSPEEFHFFNALVAISFAIGRDVRLFDQPFIYGNLFTCLLGTTGSGKSKSQRYLMDVLRDALPYDRKNPNTKGVRIIKDAASAEVLIDKFNHPVEDPTNPKKIAYNAPVRGLIEYNELSGLTNRSIRTGSALTPTLLSFADTVPIVSTTSRTHGDSEAVDPFACATTTVQPGAITTLLNKVDAANGFLNRWTFVPGTSKPSFGINRHTVDITLASPLLSDIFGWAGSFAADEYIDWQPEAEKTFIDFLHGKIEPDHKKKRNDLSKRVDLLLKKITLLLVANKMHRVVELEDVEHALGMYEYFDETYDILAGILGGSYSFEMELAIMTLLQKYPEGLTLSQIDRSFRRRKYTSEELERKLKAMSSMGKIESVQLNKGRVGRPSIKYRLAS